MAIENFYPITGATHGLPASSDAWTNAGGANKNASTRPGGGRAGPATHDDDSTYVTASGSVLAQSFNIDWPSPIISLNGHMHLSARHRVTSGTSTRVARFQDNSQAGSSLINVTDSSTSYVSTTSADAGGGGADRPGGGAWVLTDFDDENSIYIQLVLSGSVGPTRVTSVWGDLDYTPPGGSFMLILNLAGLAALPFVGRLTDIGQFRSYLSWRRAHHRRHTILREDEIRQAWNEYRAWTWRTYFLPRLAAA